MDEFDEFMRNGDCDLMLDGTAYAKIRKCFGEECMDCEVKSLSLRGLNLTIEGAKIEIGENGVYVTLPSNLAYDALKEIVSRLKDGNDEKIPEKDEKAPSADCHKIRKERNTPNASWKCLQKKNTYGCYIYDVPLEAVLKSYEKGEKDLETIKAILKEAYAPAVWNDGTANKYAYAYKAHIKKLAASTAEVEIKPNEVKLNNKFTEPKKKVFSLDDAKDMQEIWDMLPIEFTYDMVKALAPVRIKMHKHMEFTYQTIKEFFANPRYDCIEVSPGAFKKTACR